MKIPCRALAIFAFCFSSLFANSLVSVEEAALRRVAIGINLFKAVNGGRAPKNWDDLASVIDLKASNSGLEQRVGYKIEDRYKLLDAFIPYADQEGSKILVIRLVPLAGNLSDAKSLYRYMVIETKSGEAGTVYDSEERIRAAFKKANVQLPKLSNLPQVEVESRGAFVSTSPPVVKPTMSSPCATPYLIKPVGSKGKSNLAIDISSQSFSVWLWGVLSVLTLIGIVYWLRQKNS